MSNCLDDVFYSSIQLVGGWLYGVQHLFLYDIIPSLKKKKHLTWPALTHCCLLLVVVGTYLTHSSGGFTNHTHQMVSKKRNDKKYTVTVRTNLMSEPFKDILT